MGRVSAERQDDLQPERIGGVIVVALAFEIEPVWIVLKANRTELGQIPAQVWRQARATVAEGSSWRDRCRRHARHEFFTTFDSPISCEPHARFRYHSLRMERPRAAISRFSGVQTNGGARAGGKLEEKLGCEV